MTSPRDTTVEARMLPYRQMVPVDRLIPNPDNPRKMPAPGPLKELEKSIRTVGLKQPLLVVPATDKGVEGEEYFYIEDGWRRYLAMRDWASAIPCYAFPPIRGESQAIRNIVTALATDAHRENLAPIDRARALGRLRDEFKVTTIKELAELTSLSESVVSDSLVLLELAPATQDRLWRGPSDKRTNTLQVGEAKRLARTQRRSERRRRTGGTGRAGAVWEPLWLAHTHPLYTAAAERCDALGHNMRRRIGKEGKYPGACGQCWQLVIERAAEARILERCAAEVYKQDPALAGRWRTEAQAK